MLTESFVIIFALATTETLFFYVNNNSLPEIVLENLHMYSQSKENTIQSLEYELKILKK